MIRSITDPKALAPFYKPPGVAFTTYQPRTNWPRIAMIGAEFVGLVSFVGLIAGVLWSAGQ
jgi:hypothetical protein